MIIRAAPCALFSVAKTRKGDDEGGAGNARRRSK